MFANSAPTKTLPLCVCEKAAVIIKSVHAVRKILFIVIFPITKSSSVPLKILYSKKDGMATPWGNDSTRMTILNQ